MPEQAAVTACHDRISAEDYRPPRPHEFDLEPCRFCFPDGDVDRVDEDELLVTTKPHAESKLHRTATSEGPEWSPGDDYDQRYFNALRDENVTSLEDLADALEGGESGGE